MSALVSTPAVVSWPAAVSPFVAPLLNGPPRPRRVLGAFATCLYVELGAHERVIAVHTPDAVHLPIGLRRPLRGRLRSACAAVAGRGRTRGRSSHRP